MKELVETLDAWQSKGRQVGRALVIRTYGSAPRQPGSVLLYSSEGELAGSVSGGCVETAAATDVDAARTTGKTRVVRYGITDEQAWSVGLACGGMIDILVEPAVPGEAIAAAKADAGSAVITRLPGEEPADPQPHLLFTRQAGLRGSSGSAHGDATLAAAADDALLRGASRVVDVDGAQYFIEAFAVRPRLVVVGAVEIARPLVSLASQLGFATVVIDGRPSFVTRERFPEADELIIGWADEIAEGIGLSVDDSVAVLSHDPKFDEPAIVTALERGCRYVGAIGSKKTQSDRRARLREQGLSEAALERLHGPIGLDLGGREPAEIALAVLAEIVAARYGASGEALRDRARESQVAG